MNAILGLFQSVADFIEPIVRFFIWIWPLKISSLHDGEVGIILTFGNVRSWRKNNIRGPGLTLYGPFESLRRCQKVGCYVDVPEQHILTLDNKLLRINAAYVYDIIDVRKALLLTNERQEAVSGILMDLLRTYAYTINSNNLTNSDLLYREIIFRINRKISRFGIRIRILMLTELRPDPTQMLCDAIRYVADHFTATISVSDLGEHNGVSAL